MKTPMNIYNTAMKKKKNRKGFSLVELIVVLVIMAILAAALVPTLIGYISKTKEQNVQNECQQAVQAAQTIASGCYADASGSYTFKDGDGNEQTVASLTAMAGAGAADQIAALAEVPGTITDVAVNNQGLVTNLTYSNGGKTSEYTRADVTSPGSYSNS